MDPLSYFQAIVLGLLQGVAEPFPISSLGQSVVLPHLLGWNIHQNDDFFLTFLVGTHLATAIVLVVIFRSDWARIIRGMGRSLRDREIAADDPDAKLGWLIVVGTIPAGVIGLLLEHSLRHLFASPTSAAIFLAVNGALLLGFERLRARPPAPGDGAGDGEPRMARVTWRQGVAVGTAQVGALIPGISRSGITMGGGLLSGLSNEDAAHYGFLLATPIIGAAAVLKLPDAFGPAGDGVRGQMLVGALCAAVTAWFAVRFLMRYFETSRLTPFGVFCLIEGIVLTLVFTL
jgi:undecaprenyl-diphosphatase